ncbi:MAG: F0F1 ATP synthase subunit delta [Pseudomonadota bacterium]
MTNQNAATGAAARRYASAFIDTAIESKSLDIIEKDLNNLSAMIESSEDLRAVLNSPMLKREEQAKAILALADKAKFNDITKNLLALLCENRRLPILTGVIGAVHNEISTRRGEVNARVQTASALSASETQALQKSLSEAMGQNVTLDVEVKKDLIGGMVVTVGSKMIDDSVKRKLERLKQAMKSGANQNATQAKAS